MNEPLEWRGEGGSAGRQKKSHNHLLQNDTSERYVKAAPQNGSSILPEKSRRTSSREKDRIESDRFGANSTLLGESALPNTYEKLPLEGEAIIERRVVDRDPREHRNERHNAKHDMKANIG